MTNIDWEAILQGILHFFRDNFFALFGLLLIIIILERIGTFLADHYIKEDQRRLQLKKWLRYAALFSSFLSILFIYSTYAHKNTFFLVGLFLAGIAISLRDIFSNFVGWLIINSQKGFYHGDRIQIGKDIAGDVIDIGVLRTTLIEIGEWVDADQSTGRLITIPNSFILTNAIYNYTVGHDLIWNELSVIITFESDWETAEKIILQIAQDDFEERKEFIVERLRTVRKRYFLRYNFISPKVYVKIGDSGIMLSLRYMVRARQRRTMDDMISREILKQFIKEKSIELAYPTTRIFRKDENATQPSL